jgi:hypothetical protein
MFTPHLRLTPVLLVLAACAGARTGAPSEHRIEDATTLVTGESGVLSGPNDLSVDDEGNIYILDYLLAQIVVVSPSGSRLRTIGRHGEGPGEFELPRSFLVDGDTVRVVDVGAGRLQILNRDGRLIRAVPLPPGASMGEVAVDEVGHFLVPTLGMQGVLVVYHDATGEQLRSFGTPPAPFSTTMSFTAIKKEILGGTVPALFRNTVLPVFAPDGGFWLVLQGEGLVQRYDSLGSLLVAAPLVAPEMKHIWQHLVEFTKTILNDQRRMAGLAYVTDAAVVDGELWVLLNTPEDDPTVLLALGGDGTLVQRLVFTKVHGAQHFVLDRPRGRVLFLVPSDASVVAAPWPQKAVLRSNRRLKLTGAPPGRRYEWLVSPRTRSLTRRTRWCTLAPAA